MDKTYLKVDGMIFNAGTDTDMVNYANAEGIEPHDYEITEKIENGDTLYIWNDVLATYDEKNQVFSLNDDEFKEWEHMAKVDPDVLERVENVGTIVNNGK
jgi:hypothetical protein